MTIMIMAIITASIINPMIKNGMKAYINSAAISFPFLDYSLVFPNWKDKSSSTRNRALGLLSGFLDRFAYFEARRRSK